MFTKRPVPEDSINFLKQHRMTVHPPVKKKKRPVYKMGLFLAVFLLVSFLAYSNRVLVSSTESSRNFTKGGILSQLKNLLIKNETDVAGAKENRINMLLLGVGGHGHEGAYLTDTIIIASLQPDEGQAALLSIPRDLYVTSKELGGAKVNAVYVLAEQEGLDGGTVLKDALSESFGIPIHYYSRIDFDGFMHMIDLVGGVDVHVDRSFVDEKFPADNFQMQVVSFEQGDQHLDGLTALQYARSRHGNAGQGSDFARARRQQKILLALKNKLFAEKIYLKPGKMKDMLSCGPAPIRSAGRRWTTGGRSPSGTAWT